MLAKGHTVTQWVDELAPKHYAIPDDRIGLQLGTLNKEISKIIVALDVTDEVIDEAIREGANLIIAHHAIIYRALQHIRTDLPAGRMYERLIKYDIAVYIVHTNLDAVDGGMNDWMAQLLELKNSVHLETNMKDYTSSIGRVGKLSDPISLTELVHKVKSAFDVDTVRVVGDLGRIVHKVGVIGGAGGKYVNSAVFAGADVLITGDIDYHAAHDALSAGLALIDPGHNAEKIMKERVAAYLNERLSAKKYDTLALASQVNTEPFQFR